jgi:hypothetical protein
MKIVFTKRLALALAAATLSGGALAWGGWVFFKGPEAESTPTAPAAATAPPHAGDVPQLPPDARETINRLPPALQAHATQLLIEQSNQEREERRQRFSALSLRLQLSPQQVAELEPMFVENKAAAETHRAFERVLNASQRKEYKEFIEEAAAPSGIEYERRQARELIGALKLDPSKLDAIATALTELSVTELERIDKWGDDQQGLLKEEMALSLDLLRPLLTPEELTRYADHLEQELTVKLAQHKSR